MRNFSGFLCGPLIASAIQPSHSNESLHLNWLHLGREVIMLNKLLIACLILIPCVLHADNSIYRWVDEEGMVHYGDTVPDRYKDSATRKPELKEHQVIDVTPTTREQQARDRALDVLDVEPKANTPNPAAPASTNTPAVSENTADMTCEEQWTRYNASQACFAPYRVANGAIRPEAFDNCVVVPQPQQCE